MNKRRLVVVFCVALFCTIWVGSLKYAGVLNFKKTEQTWVTDSEMNEFKTEINRLSLENSGT